MRRQKIVLTGPCEGKEEGKMNLCSDGLEILPGGDRMPVNGGQSPVKGT